MPVIIDPRIAQAVVDNRDRIVAFLKEIVEHSSASVDKAGVDWIGERVTREMPRSFTREAVNQDRYGNHLVFSHLRPPLLPVVMGGHMDTVCPPGFDRLTPDGDRLRGPATADMKGGLAVLVWSLNILEQTGLLDNIPVVCLFNTDEEVNSPTWWNSSKPTAYSGRPMLFFSIAGRRKRSDSTPWPRRSAGPAFFPGRWTPWRASSSRTRI